MFSAITTTGAAVELTIELTAITVTHESSESELLPNIEWMNPCTSASVAADAVLIASIVVQLEETSELSSSSESE